MIANSLREELMDEVDDVWSETLRHLPMAQGARVQARALTEFTAVIRTGDRDTHALRFDRAAQSRGGIASEGGYLRIDRIKYPDLEIRKLDKLVALDRDGQPIFEVQMVDDRSHLRLICELGDAN